MSVRGRVPDVLPFTKADLRLPMTLRKGQRNSMAYDLLNTLLHFPGDLTFMALSFFRDPDFATPEFESLGYYSLPDFVALGRSYGLDEKSVRGIMGEFKTQLPQVDAMVAESLLSEDAKKEYLRIFRDRLAMFHLM